VAFFGNYFFTRFGNYFRFSILMTSTFVIFFGSGVPVSRTSTFWYTFGEFIHFVRPASFVDFVKPLSKALRGLKTQRNIDFIISNLSKLCGVRNPLFPGMEVTQNNNNNNNNNNWELQKCVRELKFFSLLCQFFYPRKKRDSYHRGTHL